MITVSKKTNILYWVFTGLFAFIMIGSAIPDILMMPVAMKGMHEELGYPAYFVPYLGTAKLLGVIAILIPGFPRIKEWAYAGLIFDLVSATYSVAAYGKPVGDWIAMPVFVVLGFISYGLYHKKYKQNATA